MVYECLELTEREVVKSLILQGQLAPGRNTWVNGSNSLGPVTGGRMAKGVRHSKAEIVPG